MKSIAQAQPVSDRISRVDVDVVVAHRDVGDDAQLRSGRVEERAVHAVVQHRHHALGAGHEGMQLVRLERAVGARHLHLPRLAEPLERRLGDRTGDDDARGHGAES
jgi:hypothetical protein